jgi:hypothetical protein
MNKKTMKLFIYKINLPNTDVENTLWLQIIFWAYTKNEAGDDDKSIYLTQRHGSLKDKGIPFIHQRSSVSILKH